MTSSRPAEWEAETLAPVLARSPERRSRFVTISGRSIERLSSIEDLADFEYERDAGDPGTLPYTRGIHETGYRGKLWTMRQFAGYGSPVETNARYRRPVRRGGTAAAPCL